MTNRVFVIDYVLIFCSFYFGFVQKLRMRPRVFRNVGGDFWRDERWEGKKNVFIKMKKHVAADRVADVWSITTTIVIESKK